MSDIPSTPEIDGTNPLVRPLTIAVEQVLPRGTDKRNGYQRVSRENDPFGLYAQAVRPLPLRSRREAPSKGPQTHEDRP